MTTDRSHATLACACRRCGLAWLHDYDVLEWTDTEGSPVTWYSDHGITVPNPFQHGMCCPGCGGLRVDVVPARPGATIPVPAEAAEAAGQVPAPGLLDGAGVARLPFGPPYPAF